MRRKNRRNNLKLGDSNAIDDITGFKHKRSEMVKLSGTQKGLLTHKSNWNPAHPQLFIRGREDKIAVEDTRIRVPDNFADTGVDWILFDGKWEDTKFWQDDNFWYDENQF